MGGKSKSVTVGYWYYMDTLMTLCHSGVNDLVEIREIQVGDRTAWTGSVSTSQTIGIYKKELFGGETREGGVEGQVDVMMGLPTQPVNEYMGASMRVSGIAGPVPAYRGVVSLFFRGSSITDPEFTDNPEWSLIGTPAPPYHPILDAKSLLPLPAFRWSGINPYFKSPRVKMLRIYQGWYPAKSRIGNLMNPAHIVYEVMTNAEWGMGYPTGDMDNAKFTASADQLYTEEFGLGLRWTQQSSIEDFLALILLHVNGVITQDRTTGAMIFKLIREDTDLETVLELNPTNCTLESYSRPGFGETVNEVVLRYTADNGETDAVTVQDLAGITSQGQVISQAIDLPGIRSATLAARVAQRELESRCRPISKITLTTNRIAFNLYEGDVFRFVWPDHGITAVYYRVLQVDLGRLEDNQITIEAVEDVFGLPSTSYAKPQPIGWVDTNQTAMAVINQRVVESSYYEIMTGSSEADRLGFPEDFGIAMTMAVKPQTDTIQYRINSSPDNVTFDDVGSGDWTPSGLLATSLGRMSTDVSFTLTAGTDLSKVAPGTLGYIGEEMIEVISIVSGVYTAKRGVVDAIPLEHAVGTRVWFHGTDYQGVDPDPKVDDEVAYYKFQTKSSMSLLPLSSAPSTSITFDNRFERPYPPANVRIGGEYFPTRTVGVQLTWSHRDRTLQTVEPVSWFDASIGPEPGVKYNVEIRTAADVLVTSESNVVGNTWTAGDVVLPNPSKVIVRSVRDGLVSKEKFEHTVALAGYGYAYGQSYGGKFTAGVIKPRPAEPYPIWSTADANNYIISLPGYMSTAVSVINASLTGTGPGSPRNLDIVTGVASGVTSFKAVINQLFTTQPTLTYQSPAGSGWTFMYRVGTRFYWQYLPSTGDHFGDWANRATYYTDGTSSFTPVLVFKATSLDGYANYNGRAETPRQDIAKLFVVTGGLSDLTPVLRPTDRPAKLHVIRETDHVATAYDISHIVAGRGQNLVLLAGHPSGGYLFNLTNSSGLSTITYFTVDFITFTPCVTLISGSLESFNINPGATGIHYGAGRWWAGFRSSVDGITWEVIPDISVSGDALYYTRLRVIDANDTVAVVRITGEFYNISDGMGGFTAQYTSRTKLWRTTNGTTFTQITLPSLPAPAPNAPNLPNAPELFPYPGSIMAFNNGWLNFFPRVTGTGIAIYYTSNLTATPTWLPLE